MIGLFTKKQGLTPDTLILYRTEGQTPKSTILIDLFDLQLG